nr:MAG TPA: MqsA [Caudoviricetes sp.]
MRYRCYTCGKRFRKPEIVTVRENLDGENGWETRHEAQCPKCGGDDFEEADSEQDAE